MARRGWARLGAAVPVEAGQTHCISSEVQQFAEAWPGQARPGQARPGMARLGEARPGKANTPHLKGCGSLLMKNIKNTKKH